MEVFNLAPRLADLTSAEARAAAVRYDAPPWLLKALIAACVRQN